MKLLLILSIACSSIAHCFAGGTITGFIRAEGKQGANSAGTSGNYDSRKFKFAERVNYDDMRDFVVFIEGPQIGASASTNTTLQIITSRKINQKGAMFSPHVLPVMAGTTVEWPNNDEIFHNVFSMSDAKPFDLGLYKHPEVKKVTFDKPGRVDAFCSIHSSMSCIILVLENPWFAVTDSRGRYAITNVPPGHYKLKAWHERLPAQSRELTVSESGEVKADFTLGILNLPKY